VYIITRTAAAAHSCTNTPADTSSAVKETVHATDCGHIHDVDALRLATTQHTPAALTETTCDIAEGSNAPAACHYTFPLHHHHHHHHHHTCLYSMLCSGEHKAAACGPSLALTTPPAILATAANNTITVCCCFELRPPFQLAMQKISLLKHHRYKTSRCCSRANHKACAQLDGRP
jgi:hypothetical protein